MVVSYSRCHRSP